MQPVSRKLLNISKDGDFTISPGNLSHCLVTLTVKKVFSDVQGEIEFDKFGRCNGIHISLHLQHSIIQEVSQSCTVLTGASITKNCLTLKRTYFNIYYYLKTLWQTNCFLRNVCDNKSNNKFARVSSGKSALVSYFSYIQK